MDLGVERLEFDPDNDHAARHGVSDDEILQAFDNEPRFFRNKGGRSGEYVMIGRSYGGRLLTVPLTPTPQAGTYSVITAFDNSAGDRVRYPRAGGE